MIEKLDMISSKLANLQTIRALRRGLLYSMPLILIGSAILAILNLPIPAYQNFLLHFFGGRWRDIGLSIYKGTLQIIALTTLITVSYAVSKEKELVKSGEVNSIMIVLTSLASFIAFNDNFSQIIRIEEAGSAGMLKSLVISILACNLFCFFYKCCIRIKPLELISYNGGALIRSSFRAVIPALLTVVFFSSAKLLLDYTGLDYAQSTLLNFLNESQSKGQNLFSTLIITQILWFFGIHGGNVVMNTMPTAVASSAPNVGIFTKGFFDTYVYLGGAGATLGLLVALLLIGRKSNENRLAKASALPAIFNINETMLYGLPIIFNPYYFIPFLLSPIVLCFTAWISVRIGWAPPVTQAVEWTTPIFLSGYLATGSVAGIMMQAVNLAFAVLIYIPFIRLQQSDHQRTSVSVLKNLTDDIQYVQETTHKTIFNSHDEAGYLARTLAAELKYGFMNNKLPMHLEYQPKTNHKGEVMGAEALLRWIHPVYGYVSPLVILSICDEANLTNELGSWVINQAFSDLHSWHQQGYTSLSLSVNLSPRQLHNDKQLVRTIQSCINRFELEPRYMELELTENAAIVTSDSTLDKLELIKSMGLNLSIDDFGMGHSSLLYLCDFRANIVKIDASLIRTIASDKQRQHIIKSILSLCSQLNVKVVAEGVETEEQVDVLLSQGCQCFQGFYFSRPLTFDKFLEFVNENGCIQEEAILLNKEPG